MVMAELGPPNLPKYSPSEIKRNGTGINEPDDQNTVAANSTLPGIARILKKLLSSDCRI